MGGLRAFSQLLGPASATGPGFLTTSAQTVGKSGTMTWQMTHQDGASETIAKWLLDEDTGSFQAIDNASPSNTVYLAQLRGVNSSSNVAQTIAGQGTTDSGANALINFIARIGTSTSVVTRPLYNWLNVNTSVMKMAADGGLSVLGGSAPGLTVGASGTKITQTRVYSQSLTPASVAANATAEQTFTVSGVTTADKVTINGPAPTAGTGIVGVRVSAADTVAITFVNATAGALTPASGTHNIVATRS